MVVIFYHRGVKSYYRNINFLLGSQKATVMEIQDFVIVVEKFTVQIIF